MLLFACPLLNKDCWQKYDENTGNLQIRLSEPDAVFLCLTVKQLKRNF